MRIQKVSSSLVQPHGGGRGVGSTKNSPQARALESAAEKILSQDTVSPSFLGTERKGIGKCLERANQGLRQTAAYFILISPNSENCGHYPHFLGIYTCQVKNYPRVTLV